MPCAPPFPACASCSPTAPPPAAPPAQPLLREGDAQAWLPFDTPGGARRFLRHFAPRAGVLMETEIWPNVLAAARARGLPLVLANARLSERSRRRGARVDALLRPAFEAFTAALAQSDADATRLREAGVASVGVVGNLKFDLAPDPALLALGKRWKARVARPVVLAAITREGEEALAARRLACGAAAAAAAGDRAAPSAALRGGRRARRQRRLHARAPQRLDAICRPPKRRAPTSGSATR